MKTIVSTEITVFGQSKRVELRSADGAGRWELWDVYGSTESYRSGGSGISEGLKRFETVTGRKLTEEFKQQIK